MTASPASDAPASRPLIAGVVTALVGFTSTFAVVLTGLRAVGATADQAASGLLALCVMVGLGCLFVGARYRMPITIAWSTPGVALLAATGAVDGGWPAVVGGFLVSAVLILLAGFFPPLGAQLEAMITDPVYEGKSLAGLIDLVGGGDIPKDSHVLYAHLGGQPAINAYHALWP